MITGNNMKKIIVLLFLFLLCSCSSKPKESPTTAYFSEREIDITTIKMKEVDSSAISYLGYENNILIVVFSNSYDRCYVYNEIPKSIYNELISAESIGHYFNTEIKGEYPSNRIDGVEVIDGYIKYKW